MDRRFTEKLQDLDLSMGIGETSRVTGASQAQIRYWEKKKASSPRFAARMAATNASI